MSRTRDQAPSARTTVKQTAKRADYETATLYQIIDEALVGTVSIAVDGQPFALPMMVARIDDHIYLHGSRTSRIIKHLTAGYEACIAFMLIDGIVVARSGMTPAQCGKSRSSLSSFGPPVRTLQAASFSGMRINEVAFNSAGKCSR